jgi:hypothetical protein
MGRVWTAASRGRRREEESPAAGRGHKGSNKTPSCEDEFVLGSRMEKVRSRDQRRAGEGICLSLAWHRAGTGTCER